MTGVQNEESAGISVQENPSSSGGSAGSTLDRDLPPSPEDAVLTGVLDQLQEQSRIIRAKTPTLSHDIVIPVREGEHNPQLATCLRSIAENVPHNRLWLVGHIPRWVSDEVGQIPTAQGGIGWLNVMLGLAQVAEHSEVSDQFWYFNDDFYVVKKIKDVHPWYDMSLADRARRLKGISLGSYSRGAVDTLDLLRSHGYEEPLNYDLHTPMPMDKERIGQAIDLVIGSARNFWPHLRSVYGAIAQLEGKQHPDVKITSVSGMIPGGATYVSSSVRSFNGQLGRQLRAKFATKSKFEK